MNNMMSQKGRVFLNIANGDCVKDVAIKTNISQVTISNKITIYMKMGLVTKQKIGKEQRITLTPLGLRCKNILFNLNELHFDDELENEEI